MKMSIAKKMALLVSVMLIGLSILSVIFSTFFVDDYFRERLKSDLEEAYRYISDNQLDDMRKLEEHLQILEAREGIWGMIFFDDMIIKAATIPRFVDEKDKPVHEAYQAIVRENQEAIDAGGYYEILLIDRGASRELIYVRQLENRDYLLLQKSLNELDRNIAVFNELFMIVAAVTLVIGIFIAILVARRMTRPIIELSQMAKDMSNLEFDKVYTSSDRDEIDVLGASMNQVSSRLNTALTELKSANEKLEEDIERERHVDEMRRSMIANISHELKTPIGIIKGYSEGLMYDVVDEEKKQNYLNVIVDESDRMDRLLKGLLELSYMESEVFKLDETLFNLSVLVDEIMRKFKPLMDEKGITAKVKADEDYFVQADYYRIEQVMKNYLTNAMNHVDEQLKIKVSVVKEDETVKVSVMNSGPNIDEADMTKIWDSFTRIKRATEHEKRGSGLGLAIVKSIIEKHQGSYGVKNLYDDKKESYGVIFWFELRANPVG